MKEKIVAALRQLEEERNCRMLFAVEGGSRAWGFASPDSDYDVRAVYVKPLDWYLQLNDPSTDTITAMLPDDLDIVAWDLRKFLRHLNKSNASVLEWLASPIVYMNGGLLSELNGLVSNCAEPAHIAFHYASMFRHAMTNRTPDGMISVKKLCYALRANLCVRWTVEKGAMPPTAFASVVGGLTLSSDQRQAIDRLLALKSGACEADRILPDSCLDDLLQDRFEDLSQIKWPERSAEGVLPLLSDIFRRWVKFGERGQCE